MEFLRNTYSLTLIQTQTCLDILYFSYGAPANVTMMLIFLHGLLFLVVLPSVLLTASAINCGDSRLQNQQVIHKKLCVEGAKVASETSANIAQCSDSSPKRSVESHFITFMTVSSLVVFFILPYF